MYNSSSKHCYLYNINNYWLFATLKIHVHSHTVWFASHLWPEASVNNTHAQWHTHKHAHTKAWTTPGAMSLEKVPHSTTLALLQVGGNAFYHLLEEVWLASHVTIACEHDITAPGMWAHFDRPYKWMSCSVLSSLLKMWLTLVGNVLLFHLHALHEQMVIFEDVLKKCKQTASGGHLVDGCTTTTTSKHCTCSAHMWC